MSRALQIRRAVNACSDQVYHARLHGNLIYTILPSHDEKFCEWLVVDHNNKAVKTTHTIDAAKQYIRQCLLPRR